MYRKMRSLKQQVSDNRIYFHGAKEGNKADAIKVCDKVCLTVWNQGFAIEIEHMTGKLVSEK